MTLYFPTILSCFPENGANFHQRKTENTLSAPFTGVKSLILIEPYAAGPDGIAVRTLDEPGIPGIQQLLLQILVLREFCKQTTHGHKLTQTCPNCPDITLCLPSYGLLPLVSSVARTALADVVSPKITHFWYMMYCSAEE